MSGDLRSMPSVGIMTERFVSAAALMASVLGADGYPFVTIPHPISSAATEALVETARMAAAQCAEILLVSPEP